MSALHRALPGIALALAALASCLPFGVLNNPVDPSAASYQGYLTVASDSDMRSLSPLDGAALSIPRFVATGYDKATTYHLQISSAGDPLFAASIVYEDSTFATSVMRAATLVDKVSIGESLYWRVRVFRSDSTWSAFTAASKFTVASIPDAQRSPADNSNAKALLSWQAPAGGSSAQIQLAKDVSGLAASSLIPAGAFSFDAGHLCATPGDVWYWRVRPLSADGFPGFWSPIFKFSVGPQPPTAPAALAASNPGVGSLVLGWNAVVGATGYRLYRDPSATGPFTTKIYEGPSTVFADSALAKSSTYYYRVAADNGSGQGALSAPASGTTSALSTVMRLGLAAEWLLDGNALDSSGNGKNGSLVSVGFGPNRLLRPNAALSLSGAGYVDIGNYFDFGTGDFSISLWFTTPSPAALMQVLGKNMSPLGSPPYSGYQLRLNAGVLEFGVAQSGALGTVIKTTALVANTWYHAVAVRQGSGLSLYLNGLLVDSAQAPSVYTIDSLSSLCLGAMKDSSGTRTQYFTGSIDDVRIYNLPLNQAEVLALATEQ